MRSFRVKGQVARVKELVSENGLSARKKVLNVMENKGFKGLLTWRRAYELALNVYKETKNFPKDEQYGLVAQIRRAAVSISANIAEGYERQYRKEYIRFLNIAKGSLGEVETYLSFSQDLGYINNQKYERLEIKRQEVGKLLKGLIRSLLP